MSQFTPLKRLFLAAFCLIALAACTPETAATSTPPTPLPSPLPLLPTPELNVLALTPNQRYEVEIIFARNVLPVMHITDAFSGEFLVSFELQTQNPESPNPVFTLSEGAEWGTPYILYALNQQAALWNRPYNSVDGILVLNAPRRTLAYVLCNVSGGRDQFCDDDRLWLFDVLTGQARLVAPGADGMVHSPVLRFSDDGMTITATGCLNYDYPGFGFCTQKTAMTWDVSTGQFLDQKTFFPATATP